MRNLYAQGASLHIKSEDFEKKSLLNGRLEMDGRLQMGECAEIQCLDVAIFSQ